MRCGPEMLILLTATVKNWPAAASATTLLRVLQWVLRMPAPVNITSMRILIGGGAVEMEE